MLPQPPAAVYNAFVHGRRARALGYGHGDAQSDANEGSERGRGAGKSQKSLDNLAGRGESTSRHASQGPSPSSGLMTRDASQTRTSHRGLRFHGRAVKLADIDEAKVRAEYAAASKGDDDDSKAAADAAKAMAAAIEVQL